MNDPALEGARVIVTRPPEEAEELARRLADLGAEPLQAPTIRIAPTRMPGRLASAIRAAAEGRYDWLVLTSAAGVRAWFARAHEIGAGRPSARVAAVGTGTAEALSAHGVEADLVPESFTTAALARALPRGDGRVLLARADIAPPDLERGIARRGWSTEEVVAYRTITSRSLPAEVRAALREGTADAVLFTSPSTVRGFVGLAGAVRGPKIVCIGPVTSRAAREAGLRVHAVARPHTVDGLIEALARALQGRRVGRLR